MGIRVSRFSNDGKVAWGVVLSESELQPIAGEFESLAALLTDGLDAVHTAATADHGTVSARDVTYLSPVTKPARIICQGANYANHRSEAGMLPERPPFNLIFHKSDTSLTGPTDDVVRPANVRLLDYEVEVGLVIGKSIPAQTEVTSANFVEYVAGMFIADDVSARDVQLLEGQWYKGKSYRTFCPAGPYLYLFDADEAGLIHDLELRLSVNGEVRQVANTSQLLFKPEETLTELSEIFDLMPGDVILTGTPGGVALKLSQDEAALLNNPVVSFADKQATLMESQSRIDAYLRDGDEIVCTVKSKDGRVDLGTQKNRVVSAG
ncbi:fumarylacetoacetate hydrolase family protein [Alicyclobacillus curvatus]|jgi:2-keto-4-pentenoate hydratase/2-oxohepta-3-ene-1,7-dioic acid hydratase in catechol pathway|nr:fumarylacetoacetate hydrolase family protein [Alicyclobacillus curvatus]